MLHGCINKRMDKVPWRNKIQKEQISLKKEAEKAMRKVEVTVSFVKEVQLLVKDITLNGKKDGKN